ncbi:di-N-acetylchitobiase-like [Oscarella lobularis]|uniref:di-N-acetylchitobiase-like n=1 Tax=Oscarella lobularis TaxID=121494 RepID=UPI0033144220
MSLLFVVAAAAVVAAATYAACPCKSPSWCESIKTGPRKEVLGFTTKSDHWPHYDWSKVTTLALFHDIDNATMDLVCYAHSKGVRVVNHGNFDVADLLNATARAAFVSDQISVATANYLDGVNIDIESPLNSTAMRAALVELVAETRRAFAEAIPGSQISYDVAWSPDCIDGRCYDAVGLARVTDFLVVMSYDERSQIWGPCVASANSPLPMTARGIEEYMNLGIDPYQLVLGQPWYGYDYNCSSLDAVGLCSLKHVPFRGAPCSDAAGVERDYAVVRQMLKNSTRVWNETFSAPFFNYVAPVDGKTHQVWYDDPESLALKYRYGVDVGLRGLAFWTVDSLDYSSTEGQGDAKAMWDAVVV